jgi:hypothetical protein
MEGGIEKITSGDIHTGYRHQCKKSESGNYFKEPDGPVYFSSVAQVAAPVLCLKSGTICNDVPGRQIT